MNGSGLLTERGTIPLTAFDVRASVDELAVLVEIEQTYRNTEEQAIEAVYTFPMPSEAALLSLSATIDGRELTGRAFATAKADEDYERAIDRGDLGILVERADDGLLTMNVGNLKPNAVVQIRIRYANWTRWEDENVRFTFPTTVAPLYGNSHVAPHQEPAIDIAAEQLFTSSAVLRGALANAEVLSPSHKIRVTQSEGSCTIALDGDARMNRDLVLSAFAPKRRRRFSVSGSSEDTHIAIASVTPDRVDDDSPRNVIFVVDCSGSMAGESIAHAREALDHALGLLSFDDKFGIVRFGSTFEIIFDQPIPVTRESLGIAHRIARNLDANLGGTELLSAIHAATTLGKGPREIILITDAHVTEIEALRPNGDDRIFVLAVSQGATEAVATHIAKTMRGATEFAIPSEDVKPKIARLMKKARSRKVVDLNWSGEPVATWSSNIAGGDAILYFAEYAKETGHARHEGVIVELQPQSDDSSSLVARLAISARLESSKDDEAAALAEKHQLLTRWTKFVLIHEQQHEREVGIPQVRKVPNELLMGYGGMGMAPAMRVLSASILACEYTVDSLVRDLKASFAATVPSLTELLNYLPIGVNAEARKLVDELLAAGHSEDQIRVVLALVLDQLGYKVLSAPERRHLRAQYAVMQITDWTIEKVRKRLVGGSQTQADGGEQCHR